MTRKPLKLRLSRLFLFALVFFIMGTLLLVGIAGFSFSALLCFGIGGLFLCFGVLKYLAGHYPRTVKWCRRILCVCICLALAAAVLTGIPIARSAAGQAGTDCAYIILLGAGVNGTVPSLSLRERLDAAFDYMTVHPDAVCVVSGGQGNGEDITEALCMYNDLIARGIPAERIWMEDKATSTKENIAFSLDLIEEKTGSRPVAAGIISNEYHLYRAGRIAGAQGLTSIPIPAKTRWVSLYINYFLREIAAVWYYSLFGGFV